MGTPGIGKILQTIGWGGLLLTLVAGCGSSGPTRAEQAAAKRAAFDAEVAVCSKNHQQQPIAHAQCVSAAETKYLGDTIPGDLVAVYTRQRVAIAAQMERRQISYEDGEARIAEARSRMFAEAERRILARRAVRAQEAAAEPAMCTRSGNSVICF